MFVIAYDRQSKLLGHGFGTEDEDGPNVLRGLAGLSSDRLLLLLV